MQIKVICSAVITKEDSFVIVQEKEGLFKDLWNITGGHLENTESLEQGAIQEIKEETGLDIKIEGFIGMYQHRSKHNNNVIAFYFQATPLNENFNFNKTEIQNAKWITFKDFLKMDQNTLCKPHLKKVIKDFQQNDADKTRIKNINL